MRPFVRHVCRADVKILRELPFDGQIPLLAIREMTVVELTIRSRVLAVIEREIEKGRLLDLRVVKPLAEEGWGSDTAVGAAKQYARVEAVASAADARVPAWIAEGLIEHPVPAPD